MKILRLLPSCLLFTAAQSLAGVAFYPNGDTIRLTVAADKPAVKPDETVTFKATVAIKKTGDFVNQPPNPGVKWKVRGGSPSADLMTDPRVSVNRSAGTLTIRNVRATEDPIQVDVSLVFWASAGSSLTVDDGTSVRISQGPSEPPANFLLSISGGGAHPLGSRVELAPVFAAGGEGSGGVRIDWYLNNKPVASNRRTLVIAKLEADDAGTYEARVTRLQDNKPDRATAAVTATLKDDFVQSIKGGGSHPSGSRVELSVVYRPGQEGTKGTRVDWYLHGKLLKANQAKLVIANLDASETGTYEAKVTRLQDGKKDETRTAVTLAKK